ncbi:MAG: ParA family protein [Gemmatimonadota bacterium]|nr:ParA family protein [Gemmatimonadota bacterium]
MKKIAILSMKGGVGKTTTAMNLGHGLSLNGERVILIDCDPQNSVGEIFDVSEEEGLSELILGKKANMSEVRRNLFVISSGGRRLFDSEVELSRRKDRDRTLCHVLGDLTNSDFVFCDCSSAMNLININVLAFVDFVIVPVGMDYFSISGLKQTFELIKEVCQRTGHQVRLMGILATQYDVRTRISREIYGVLDKMFPSEMFKTVIHNNVKLKESPAYGMTIFEYDIDSTGARDYINLTAEILASER